VSERGLFEIFKASAEAANAEVHRCAGADEAVELVVELLRSAGVCDTPGAYALWAPCELLGERARSALGPRVPGLRFDVDRSTAELARVGMSQMDYAVADTGTLVQDATAPEQRLVSTLPDVHIALCRTSALVADLPTLLERGLVTSEPSYCAMITGPSRTADIERVLTIGAHGPRRLVVVLVDELETP
jgi:L-lactate dehydrogenase complex protein LldG